MGSFNHQKISENFYFWVQSLGNTSGISVQKSDDSCWINTELKFACLNYLCNKADDTELIERAIESFKSTKTPFFFCNGEKLPHKKSTKLVADLGITNAMTLDGMVFDMSKPLPKVETAIDVNVIEVTTQRHIRDWIELSPRANGHDLDSSKEFFKNMQSDHTTYYLAYHNSKPIGCGLLFTGSDGVAGNYWGAVLPDYRCKGVCSMLALKRLERAKALGYSHVIAQCMDTSTRLYQKLGFEKVSEFEFYGVFGY